MLLFFSMLVLILGGINWLLIGLLQYDFVAGLFGYQASIFSRTIYIIVGIATAIVLFNIIKNKGKIEVFNFQSNKKKKKEKEEDKEEVPTISSSGFSDNNENARPREMYSHHEENEPKGLLNEENDD